jgi:geranylgeranyl diphosphate synthase type II
MDVAPIIDLFAAALTRRDARISSPQRLEAELRQALDQATAFPCPALLADALRYAVFPAGARIRPRLCLAVAQACGDLFPELSLASAASIELYHCASLVQDDLPCFDNAATRRGRPALHRAFGESCAVLAADGLIVLAADLLLGVETEHIRRRTAIQRCVLRAVGPRHGLVAGQAWESEAAVELARYHACKTASLFEAATTCGALASGGDERAWSIVGRCFGKAYQIADDIADHCGNAAELGKPVAQDRLRRRPNIVPDVGRDGAICALRLQFDDAGRAIPDCDGRAEFRDWLRDESTRILRVASDAVSSMREDNVISIG